MIELLLCWLNRPRLTVREVSAGGHDFYPIGTTRVLACKHCLKEHP